jgi:uncharacterized C2H2 Zn-finger protein
MLLKFFLRISLNKLNPKQKKYFSVLTFAKIKISKIRLLFCFRIRTTSKLFTKNKKMFECQICNKQFERKYSYITHIKTVHEKQNPVECPISNQKFGRKDNLITAHKDST